MFNNQGWPDPINIGGCIFIFLNKTQENFRFSPKKKTIFLDYWGGGCYTLDAPTPLPSRTTPDNNILEIDIRTSAASEKNEEKQLKWFSRSSWSRSSFTDTDNPLAIQWLNRLWWIILDLFCKKWFLTLNLQRIITI